MRGKFYSLEGLDLSGKGVQKILLQTYLEQHRVTVTPFREPGGSALAELLRKVIKCPELSYNALNAAFAGEEDFASSDPNIGRSHLAEILLFMTGRADNVEQIIKPSLAEEKTVIADRFMDSTVAYQGGGRFRNDLAMLGFINYMHEFIVGDHVPGRTFFLDISYEERCRREANVKGRHPDDVFDNLKQDFFDRVREQYKQLCETTERVVLVEGVGEPEEIFNQRIKPFIDKDYGF